MMSDLTIADFDRGELLALVNRLVSWGLCDPIAQRHLWAVRAEALHASATQAFTDYVARDHERQAAWDAAHTARAASIAGRFAPRLERKALEADRVNIDAAARVKRARKRWQWLCRQADAASARAAEFSQEFRP